MKNKGTESRTLQLLLFGDLCSAGQFDHKLFELLHVRTNPLLDQFYRQVAHDLRKHLGKLSAKQQSLFPRFTSLIDLVTKLGETEGTPVLSFCLLTVYQIAQFILYYSRDSRPYPSPSDTCCVVGSCAGGFAAAAVGSAASLMNLIPVATEAVLASFNTALYSYNIGQRLSGNCHDLTPNKDPWSVCVPGEARGSMGLKLSEVKVLVQQACQIESAAESRQDVPLWISATGADSFTTVSGRPDYLRDFTSFLGSSSTSDKRVSVPLQLPIHSPYHAAHLFDDTDVDHVMSSVSRAARELQPCHLRIMSPNTGESLRISNFTDALRVAVRAALIEPISWDHGQESLIDLLTGMAYPNLAISIIPFACHSIARMVSAALSPAGFPTTIQDPTKAPPSLHIQDPTPGRFDQSKIAIVGYSGRFPSAASNEAFWELLRAGRDVHREIPTDRFEWAAHYDPSGKKKNTSRVKYGCFIDEPGVFDARFFNMSPREAENTDPAQRLAIMAAYEAMEMGGMVRNRTPSTQQDRVGVFFGTTSDDWREVNSGQDVDTYFIPGGNRAFVPGRISYFFRFSGPSLSVDTACSSSFAAIQAACTYLWKGDCDTAIAGGTNILTNPDNFAGLDRGHFLSTTGKCLHEDPLLQDTGVEQSVDVNIIGNCNAFDDGASGYCRADAVGAVILKRLEDAQVDNDPIFGVIVGSNTNHCGQTESITRPHEGDQASVFKRVMRYANHDPLDISYIEMHGTGTQAGDATEMNSVLSVFVPGSDQPNTTKLRSAMEPPRPLFLGSAKANIGHAESASGVSSLIKVLMMMKHHEIPPHVGIKTKINHNYPTDLRERGVNIALRVTGWTREEHGRGPDKKRSVFLNNFSAAGGNTAILLEDAPSREKGAIIDSPDAPDTIDSRSTHLVTLTARSKKSLTENVASLITWLEKYPYTSLPSLSYTTTARRMHHSHRVAVTGSSVDDVTKALKSHVSKANDVSPIPPPTRTPSIVFMFSGQGTLYAALGRTLFDANATFRTCVHTLDRIVQRQGFPSFIGLIDGSISSSDVENHSVGPVISQLGLIAIQISLTDLLVSWGITPSAVIGHSLGEYAAFYASGILSADDTLYLVGSRATLLEQRCTAGTHTMLAVKVKLQASGARMGAMEKLMTSIPAADAQKCDLACANQPDVRVIGGPVDTIAEVARKASSIDGVQAVKLQVPFAFHTAQVDPILDDFERVANTRRIIYRAPVVPVLSPLLSGVVQAGVENVLNGSYLTKACRQVVKFEEALQTAVSAPGLVTDKTIWLDIGCHPACCGMVKGTLGAQYTTLATLRKDVDAYKTLAPVMETMYLAGIPIDWEEYHRDFPAAHEVLELPQYVWDLKTYWIQYKNNFCLTKGEDLGPGSPPQPNIRAANRLSTSLQRVIEEHHGPKDSSLIVESDLFDRDLLPILKGHMVNGAALCPSSLWADAATALATYMIKHKQGPQLQPELTGLDVANVKVNNPLIARPEETKHLIRLIARADWTNTPGRPIISLTVTSVNDQGKATNSHVELEVHVTPNQSWLSEWKRNAHLITSRIESLVDGVDHGTTHKIKRGMAYKLFSTIVHYSPAYRGMSEVLLDSERLEAASTVSFQTDPGCAGDFAVDPRWIDSLGHIAGFIMNASDALSGDAADKTPQVFINHGWDRMRIAEPLQMGKTYRAYNRMQLVEKTTYAGDTYVMDGDRIIAIFEGVTFQGVPKHVLDRLLPGISKPADAARHTAPIVTQPPPPQPSLSVNTKLEIPRRLEAKSDDFAKVAAIICEEVGSSQSDLKAETEFADLGIDSLLALNILSRLREELSRDLSPSIFLDFPTVGDLRSFISKSPGHEKDSVKEVSSLESISTSSSVDSEDSSASSVASLSTGCQDTQFTPISAFSMLNFPLDAQDKISSEPVPQASISRLYGKSEGAKSMLILFPDGAGSATAYASLAPCLGLDREPSDIVVYGLNCPWLKSGAEMTKLGVTIETMAAVYLDRVRQVVHDHKPPRLAFGGWSAGGILAYEALRQLREQQQQYQQDVGTIDNNSMITVDKLVFFDSPNPIGLQNPPTRMYSFFSEIGIFGTAIPSWLFAHFEAFLRALDAYIPVPMPRSSLPAPSSLIFYARDGVCKDPNGPRMETQPDDPREMLWLLNNRTEFTADGWASLLPGGSENLKVRVLDGVNHFTMMSTASALRDMGRVTAEFIMD